jgi:hypothetical protein
MCFQACGGMVDAGAPSTNVEENISSLCLKQEALGCPRAQPRRACEADWMARREQATAIGCSEEFEAALNCGARLPLYCHETGVDLDEACLASASELYGCMGETGG